MEAGAPPKTHSTPADPDAGLRTVRPQNQPPGGSPPAMEASGQRAAGDRSRSELRESPCKKGGGGLVCASSPRTDGRRGLRHASAGLAGAAGRLGRWHPASPTFWRRGCKHQPARGSAELPAPRATRAAGRALPNCSHSPEAGGLPQPASCRRSPGRGKRRSCFRRGCGEQLPKPGAGAQKPSGEPREGLGMCQQEGTALPGTSPRCCRSRTAAP